MHHAVDRAKSSPSISGGVRQSWIVNDDNPPTIHPPIVGLRFKGMAILVWHRVPLAHHRICMSGRVELRNVHGFGGGHEEQQPLSRDHSTGQSNCRRSSDDLWNSRASYRLQRRPRGLRATFSVQRATLITGRWSRWIDGEHRNPTSGSTAPPRVSRDVDGAVSRPHGACMAHQITAPKCNWFPWGARPRPLWFRRGRVQATRD